MPIQVIDVDVYEMMLPLTVKGKNYYFNRCGHWCVSKATKAGECCWCSRTAMTPCAVCQARA